jgi:hypothetical protein
MGDKRNDNSTWRQFEQLVARIEADAGPLGLSVKSPDRIRCKITGRLREVDASVRASVGTASVLMTIECRKRRPKQDVTWIEQLATKKANIGAVHTIAVSSAGFSDEAKILAAHLGIDLRHLSDVSAAEINKLLRIDFVLFHHKRCSVARVGIRLFRFPAWAVPDPQQADFVLPPATDLYTPIFKNIETKRTWSINDLWLQLQEATDPFAGIERGAGIEVKTAAFPYPGNVTVDTATGPQLLGDVMLSVALSIDVEQVTLEEARKVQYTSPDGNAVQRVEFASRQAHSGEWRISLQAPKDAIDVSQLKTGGNWPEPDGRRQGNHDRH